MSPGAAPPAARPRNATEEAILAAARELLGERDVERLTIDAIARRAFLSRTSVYFYFPNKRAVVDRLVQRTFDEVLAAAAPYVGGAGDPRRELAQAFARVVATVMRHGDVLLMAARLSGREDRLPPEWEPHIARIVRAAEARIRRDQARGIAPADLPPRALAETLTAMVERHLSLQVLRGDGDRRESVRVLTELWWRAVYAGGPAGERP